MASAPAAAQDSSPAQAAFGGKQVHAFDLPPGDLASALDGWSRITGLKFGAAGDAIKSARTRGLVGHTTAEQALGTLLRGTGLTYAATGRRTVTIYDARRALDANAQAIELETIHVQSQANSRSTMQPPPPYFGGQVATGAQVGMLGNRSVMDTPFSQISITSKRIQDSQHRTIKDVLLDDPSIRERNPTGGTDPDAIKIRGFVVSSGDIMFNGLYGILPSWSAASEIADRVEILKGPSALLNGMPPGGSVGGSINIVSKRATDAPLTQVTTSYSSSGQLGGHLDFGRRFGANKEWGIRYNGAYRKGDTAVDGQSDQLMLNVLGLDYRGDRLRVAVDIGQQDQRLDGIIPLVTVPAAFPIPKVMDTSRNWGQPWSYDKHKDTFGMVRGEVDITDKIMAYAAFGMKRSDQLMYDTGYASVTSASGNTGQITRKYGSFFEYKSGEAGVRMEAVTGPVNHLITVNYGATTRDSGNGATNMAVFASRLYDPVAIPAPTIIDPYVPRLSEITLSSIGIANTMSVLDKRLQLTVGVRKQSIDVDAFNAAGAMTSTMSQSVYSPAVAVVVKPWENVSLFANYIEGLQQGAIVGPTFKNAGEVFPPFQSAQYEAGVKVDWGTVTTTVSWFQITQPSAVTEGTAPNQFRRLNGEQRNRGLEILAFGQINDELRVLGGVMFLDARLSRTAGGVNDGLRAPGAAEVNVSLGLEWDTPWIKGLTVTGRAIHTSEQLVESTKTLARTIPAWTRYDLGMRYTNDRIRTPTGGPIVFRFNVDNVLDNDYWTSVNEGYLATGAPRTYRLSTTFNF